MPLDFILPSEPRFGVRIPNTASLYSITPDGHVVSWRKPGKRGQPSQMQEFVDNDGYLIVRLMKKAGSRRNYRIHRLVCETYHGPCPSPAHQVRHLDGNKTNNDKSNMAWGTALDNAEDRDRHGTTHRGEPCSETQTLRFQTEITHDLKLLAASYTAFDKAGRELGIDASTLAERIDLAALIRAACEVTGESKRPTVAMQKLARAIPPI